MHLVEKKSDVIWSMDFLVNKTAASNLSCLGVTTPESYLC